MTEEKQLRAMLERPLADVPTVWLDTETTGVEPDVDRVVQVGIARFERGALVDRETWLVNPGCPIPPAATEIHGIGDAHVAGAPMLAEVCASERARGLVEGAQPAAYNASFDRAFLLPAFRLLEIPWRWPWLDALSLVRVVDRFAKGQGRHKLSAACERHGVVLLGAHDAGNDARAAGEVFYRLIGKCYEEPPALWRALLDLQVWEAQDSSRFQRWLAQKEAEAAAQREETPK